MLFASGIPFDVEESIDSQNTDGIWERPLLVPEQKLTVPNRSKNEWFKTNAFGPSTYGRRARLQPCRIALALMRALAPEVRLSDRPW
jgi:hypothetical protein